MQQARSGTCDKRELGATTRNNSSKIHDESQLCSGSKLWSRPPQGNVEKDERKQYRDHSSGTNEFDEPWIKDNAARDVLFCTRMRTMQALVYIYIYIERERERCVCIYIYIYIYHTRLINMLIHVDIRQTLHIYIYIYT